MTSPSSAVERRGSILVEQVTILNDGWDMQGLVNYTLVDGKPVYQREAQS